MARLAAHGSVQPSEYDKLTPGEARELLNRIEKNRQEEYEAKAELDKVYLDSIMEGFKGVAKSIQQLTELISKKPTL